MPDELGDFDVPFNRYDPRRCDSDCPGSPRNAERLTVVEERHRIIIETLTRIENNMVTRHEFMPIQRLVYGATGLALVAVAGAVLSLVVNG